MCMQVAPPTRPSSFWIPHSSSTHLLAPDTFVPVESTDFASPQEHQIWLGQSTSRTNPLLDGDGLDPLSEPEDEQDSSDDDDDEDEDDDDDDDECSDDEHNHNYDHDGCSIQQDDDEQQANDDRSFSDQDVDSDRCSGYSHYGYDDDDDDNNDDE